MADLTPVSSFDDVVQLEVNTQALGGPGGPMNAQAQALLNRTEYLKNNLIASAIPFQQSGTGSVARMVQDKLRDRVSVKDFGAKGDGATNDTAAIQDAIAAALAGDRELFFPSGTYLCDPITITVSDYFQHLALRGEGPLSTVLKKRTGSGTGPLITLGAADATLFISGILVAEMALHANSAAETTGPLVLAYDLVRSYFVNVVFENGYTGLELAGGIFVSFDGCRWDSFGFRGLDIHGFDSLAGGGAPNAIVLRACAITNCGEQGVQFNDGRLLIIDNCDIETCGTNDTATAGSVRIESNVGGKGGLPNSYGLVCRDTWFEGAVGVAAVACLSGRNKIDGAYFVANSSATYDIYLNGCNYALDGCVFDTPRTNSIYEDVDVLDGNFIDNCGGASNNITGTKTRIDGAVKGTATIVQAGIGTTAAGTGVLAVVFPVPFPGVPHVSATAQNNSAATIINCEVYGITAAGFNVHTKSVTNGSSAVANVVASLQWMATYTP